MNYELAKKLKNAGFPFREVQEIIKLQPNAGWFTLMASFINFDGVDYYMPTLSELIEVVGGGFAELQRNGSFTRYTPKNDKWIAWGVNRSIMGGGKTPSEAVANLYLELNKK